MKNILMLTIALSAMIVLNSCAIGDKSWGAANSSDAFKAIVTEGQTGTMTPTLIAGGGTQVMLFQRSYMQGSSYPVMVGYSRRKSMWGLFSGDVGSSNVSFLYIAGSGETQADTQKNLAAISNIVNDTKLTVKQINGE